MSSDGDHLPRSDTPHTHPWAAAALWLISRILQAVIIGL